MTENQPQKKPQRTALKEDPGLLDSIGSFPVWLLRIIDFFTPDIFISKTPQKKKNLRN